MARNHFLGLALTGLVLSSCNAPSSTELSSQSNQDSLSNNDNTTDTTSNTDTTAPIPSFVESSFGSSPTTNLASRTIRFNGGSGATQYQILFQAAADCSNAEFTDSSPIWADFDSSESAAFDLVLQANSPNMLCLRTRDAAQNISNIVASPIILTTSITPPPPPSISVRNFTTPILNNQTSAVGFGSAIAGQTTTTRILTATNNGGSPLTLSLSVAASTDFRIIEPLTPMLAPGASDNFTIEFFSSTLGSRTGTALIVTNDPSNSSFQFPLSGFVAAPARITLLDGSANLVSGSSTVNFGTAAAGNIGVTKTFTIQNSGGVALNIGAISLPNSYAVTSPPSASVSAGGSTTFSVELQSSTPGTYSGNLSFTTNDPTHSMMQINLTGVISNQPAHAVLLDGATVMPAFTGSSSSGYTVNLGTSYLNGPALTHTFTIQNDGGAPLEVRTFSGANGFTVSRNLVSNTIAPGQTDYFTIQLSSAMAGSFDSWFDGVYTNGGNFLIRLNGSISAGGADPQLIVRRVGSSQTSLANNSTPISFGNMIRGTSTYENEISFTVLNDDVLGLPRDLQITNIAASSGFVVYPSQPMTIPNGVPGRFSVLMVTANPEGARTGTVTFSTNDPRVPTFTINLAGNVLPRTNANLIGDYTSTLQIDDTTYYSNNLSYSRGDTDGIDPWTPGIVLGFIGGMFVTVINKPDLCSGTSSNLTVSTGQIASISDTLIEEYNPDHSSIVPINSLTVTSAQLGAGFCISQPALVHHSGNIGLADRSYNIGKWVSTFTDNQNRIDNSTQVDTAYCTDSDSGIKTGTGGYVTLTNYISGAVTYEGDECTSDGQGIIEHYCSSVVPAGIHTFEASTKSDYAVLPDRAQRLSGNYIHTSYGQLAAGHCVARTIQVNGQSIHSDYWVNN